ncbi:hypothetical protein QVD17_20882 [Tagetes erecta]|uniref:Uncharacterized protein n=1 Tax=Tagetes erecta TaxID=13708 RepID=A0AAD8KMI8_TARER|nr:hypothetical protein QVD17_20882 [Tagetes erecta]
MKKGVSLLLKNIISITKSKLRSKVESLKAKLIICSLLKNKKLSLTLRTGSISHKIHALLHGGTDDDLKVLESANVSHEAHMDDDCVDDDDKYPDLRHFLFDEEDDDDPNASVIDLVKNSMEDEGEDFKLEDEIDHVADLFISKFHKRMRLQKLESFKRYQDMLQRGL